MVRNSITIDVEEWFHVCGAELPAADIPMDRVTDNIEHLLALFAVAGVQATFFMLGCVAEALPGLAPRIAAAGHEIASHGWSHSLVSQLTPEQFRQEVQRTSALLLRQTGQQPVGFRAPRWSLNWQEAPWTFAILAEEGFRYDSSCTPLAGLGDPRGSRTPQQLLTSAGPLWEIPPLVTPALLTNLPTGGGWGFRFFPRALIERTISQLNRQGQPAVFFIHPREVDPLGPRLAMPFWREFITYGSRHDAAPRLSHLLKRHTFVPLKDLVAAWPVA